MQIERISRVEATLGIKLPHEYLQAVRLQDTEYLDLYIRCVPSFIKSWEHNEAEEDSESIVLCGCYGLERLVSLLEPHESGWTVRLDGLDLLIVIMQDGSRFWCLDYRKCGAQGEPSVIYIDVEHMYGEETESLNVASKFCLAAQFHSM